MTGATEQPSSRLIGSDRIEGTAVYDADGTAIGAVERFLIDRQTGKVVYVVVSFGTFLDFGQEAYTIPWARLSYDGALGGFRTDVVESELRNAPRFSRGDALAETEEEELHAHFRIPPYWRSAV